MLLKIAIILLATICMSAPKVLKNSASHNSDKRVFVPRVINGWPAKLEDVPYQISLKSLLDRARLVYYNFCGGALIGPEKIVSAAHCFASSHDLGFTQCGETAMCVHVSDRTLEGKFAVAGTLLNKDKYNGNGQWRTIANVYYPDAFTLATEVVSNDIAVGYVNTPFDLNSDVAPIPYTSIHRDYHGMCLVSGYGFTEKGRKETPSPNLLLAHLDIISISSCSILFKKHMRDHVCTSVNVTATGPGDSGGPLVCSGTTDPKETSKGILVGVVSGGTDFGGYSTRVSSFITEVETCRGSNTIRVCLPQILSYADDADEPAFVSRVVNGWPAKLGDAPYQLAFKEIRSRYRKTYYTYCGGTIIGPDKVLSAAHCFEERKSGCERCWGAGEVSKKLLDKSFAVAGNLQNTAKYSRQDSLENGQWRRLKSMFIAPRYKFPKNDICVGFTELPFKFNSNVASISYAIRYRDYVGKCLVSGYGRISTWSKQTSDKLLLAHLDLFSTSWCSRIHRRNMHKFICTSSAVSDVHKGDSGGPLVCSGTGDPDSGKGVLVGVVSGSRHRAGSFFTRVSSYKEFIDTDSGFCIRGNVVMVLTSLLNFMLLFSFCFI